MNTRIFDSHLVRHVTRAVMPMACVVFTILPATVTAETRWQENGHELVFNMDIPYPDDPSSNELIQRDVYEFRSLVMENTEISLITISGRGGYGPAGQRIADTILRLGFDTHAFERCSSACARIFLAGATRTLAEDAELGFHRAYVLGEEEQSYYLANRESRGWEDEFDYVEFIYDVASTDMRQTVEFMVSRGVSIDFILEAQTYGPFEIWTPDPETLFKRGVITEMPDWARRHRSDQFPHGEDRAP